MVVALIGFKLLPSYIEYFTVQRIVSDIALARGARRHDAGRVRAAFDRRAQIDNITAVKAPIWRSPSKATASSIIANYSARVPLFANVSACIDFEAKNK